MDTATATVLEFGSGWEGATEGLKREVPRVVTVDCCEHNLGDKGTVHPELRRRFEMEGDTIRQGMKQAKVQAKETAGVWISMHCKQHSTGNGLPGGTGKFAGENLTKEEDEAMQAMLSSLNRYVQKDPVNNKYFMENVGYGSFRMDQRVKQWFGEGAFKGAREGVVKGCAYGMKHSKPYRRAQRKNHQAAITCIPPGRYYTNLTEDEWLPKNSKEHCIFCKTGSKHPEAMIPGRNDTRPRPHLPGYTVDAARNRVAPTLAQAVGKGFMMAYKHRQTKKRKRGQ